MRRALILLVVLAGCSDESYLVVTVTARPAVHDASTLSVTLSNETASRTDTLEINNHSFPLTFSVSAPGRTGTLGVSVAALDSSMNEVGAGSVMTTVDAKTASLRLDSTDFVVNSDPAMDQFLASGDYEAAGFQLAPSADGTWIATFRDNCNGGTACNILGRKLDARGVPVTTTIGGGEAGQFVLTTTPADTGAYPAAASNGQDTIVLWDYYTDAMTHGIACRALDSTGNAPAAQATITTDNADVVSVTPLSNGNFAASWQIYGPNTIRTIIVKPDCTTVTAQPFTTSVAQGTTEGPFHSTVAANGSNVMYAWIVDGDVHIRPGTNSGPTGNDTTLLTHTMQYSARIARLAPFGTGFAVVVRWGAPDYMGPGKIEMFQISPTGTVVGTPTLITDQSLSDFTSGIQSFGVATSATGELLVAWHQCDMQGTAGTCDVLGRFVSPAGSPDGAVFTIPTTTIGDQTGPSVIALGGAMPGAFAVAWTDESHQPPDPQGKAVRARIVYPPGS